MTRLEQPLKFRRTQGLVRQCPLKCSQIQKPTGFIHNAISCLPGIMLQSSHTFSADLEYES